MKALLDFLINKLCENIHKISTFFICHHNCNDSLYRKYLQIKEGQLWTHWSIMVTSNVCMHVLFPYIQPVSLNEELLHKSLLSASSNPKLGCLSDLIGYAPFVVLTEVCVRVCVGEREQEWCWLSNDHWSSPVAYRECLLGLQRMLIGASEMV